MLNELQDTLRSNLGQTITPELAARLYASAVYQPRGEEAENEIDHFIGGRAYIKRVRLKAGVRLVQHKHQFDHLSYIVKGFVEVTVDCQVTVHGAGECLTIKAGKHHGVRALDDTVWLCIHGIGEDTLEDIEELLIQPGIEEEMRRIADAMLPLQVKNLTIDVQPFVEAIEAHPEIWNRYDRRRVDPLSPHYGLDDVWFRWAPPEIETREADEGIPFVWYPESDMVPVREIAEAVMKHVGGKHLGAVLMTRITPGKSCKPHIDTGWHAANHEKYAVQIKSAPGQGFHFHAASYDAKPGEVYWFDNSKLHWVTNPTEHDRITLIVCVRKEK
jgi:quercetin dioxygenase-like cupin family protein